MQLKKLDSPSSFKMRNPQKSEAIKKKKDDNYLEESSYLYLYSVMQ